MVSTPVRLNPNIIKLILKQLRMVDSELGGIALSVNNTRLPFFLISIESFEVFVVVFVDGWGTYVAQSRKQNTREITL